MCGKHKKFLARVNTGNKLYCMQCQSKITKEYGNNYWKPCSQAEFFASMSSHMEKGSNREESNGKPRNMLSSLRELSKKWDEENANIKAAFLQFDEIEAKNKGK
jgi:hypothetical protein